jgi:hypothetical protein
LNWSAIGCIDIGDFGARFGARFGFLRPLKSFLNGQRSIIDVRSKSGRGAELWFREEEECIETVQTCD